MERTRTTPKTTVAGETFLRGDDLEKSYGSRLPFGRTTPVLTGADIEVRAGEIVGIVGENGSGKSTLMKILVRVDLIRKLFRSDVLDHRISPV